MIRISVNTRHAYKVYTEMITSGSSGIPVTFSFSPEWDGLTKIATFSGSGVQRDMVLNSLSVVVPAEVLTTAGGDLMIGVYGTDGQDGAIIIPTVWANVGRIRAGVVPCCETDPQPTATVIDQVLAAAANAVEQADTAAAEQAEIAEGHAGDAAVSAEQSEHYYELAVQAAEGKGFIWFDIGADGCLYMTRSDNLIDDVSAEINTAGELEIIIS